MLYLQPCLHHRIAAVGLDVGGHEVPRLPATAAPFDQITFRIFPVKIKIFVKKKTYLGLKNVGYSSQLKPPLLREMTGLVFNKSIVEIFTYFSRNKVICVLQGDSRLLDVICYRKSLL